MTRFRATLIWLLGRYLVPGESASPLEVQKLLYFLQEAGEPLSLTFDKQRYGPYADAARHAVQDLEGHYLIGFGDGTGSGDVRLLPGALDEATAFLADHPDLRERYEQVEQLIEGFETPYGLELLATTHWVAVREDADGPNDAAEAAVPGANARAASSPTITSMLPGSGLTREAGSRDSCVGWGVGNGSSPVHRPLVGDLRTDSSRKHMLPEDDIPDARFSPRPPTGIESRQANIEIILQIDLAKAVLNDGRCCNSDRVRIGSRSSSAHPSVRHDPWRCLRARWSLVGSGVHPRRAPAV